MKGSLKWYLRNSIKTLLMVVGWSALMCLFMGDAWFSDEGMGNIRWEDFYSIIYYIMLGYGIFSFSISLTFYKKDIPLAISMGVSRKEAFWGSSSFTLMNIAAASVLMVIMGLIAGQEKNLGNSCFLMAVVIVMGNMFGLFLGIIHKNFGWAASLITGLVLYFLLMGGVFYLATGSLLEIADRWRGMTAAVTALVWCGVSVLHYRTVQKMTV